MRILIAVGAAALAVAAVPGQAASERQPTGKWVVNFDDAQCVATRNYGPDDNPLYLVLKAPPLGGVLQIGVVRAGQVGEATQIDGELIFDGYPAIRTNLLEFSVKKLKQRALFVNLPLTDLAPMRQATSLHIRARQEGLSLGSRISKSGGGIDVQFTLTQMSGLLSTLDACVADLRRFWNIPAQADGKSPLREYPRGNLAGVIRSEEYPGVALDNEQQGTVTFALLIDERGKVADCTVTGTSGAASLDAQSCALVKERASFKPAIGMDGKPAKSSFIQRVTWRIEG